MGAPVQAGDHGEQGESGHREHDVAAPGAVAPGLRVVQAHRVLRIGEVLLHRPPDPGDLHQVGQRRRPALGDMGVEEGQLGGVSEGATDQQVMARAGGGDHRPVVEARALGALAAGEPVPRPGRDPPLSRRSGWWPPAWR